jgi:phage baseplate assembly protein W
MISPKLEGGDLVVENGNLIMISGDEELIQSVQSILRTRKGEFFLDPEYGLSYDNLLGKGASEAEIRDDIIEALSKDDRIGTVTNISFVKEGRTLKISLTIQKQDETELTIDEVELNA